MRYVRVKLMQGISDDLAREVTIAEHSAKCEVLIWGNRVFVKEDATKLTFREVNAATVLPIWNIDENGHGAGSAGDVQSRRAH